MSRDQFLQALVGSLLGLLPLLFSAISHQLENRSITTRRDQAIDLAQRRVAFLTAWLQTRQQFDSAERLAVVKESLASEFDDIKAFVDSELIRPQAVHAARSTDRNWIQRALLLYLPRSVSGWSKAHRRHARFPRSGCVRACPRRDRTLFHGLLSDRTP